MTVVVDRATGRNVTLLARPVPPEVASSTAFRAALEGLRLSGEGEEPGLTPQEALAADTAAALAAGKVGQAASPGTVVAWVYGECASVVVCVGGRVGECVWCVVWERQVGTGPKCTRAQLPCRQPYSSACKYMEPQVDCQQD